MHPTMIIRIITPTTMTTIVPLETPSSVSPLLVLYIDIELSVISLVGGLVVVYIGGVVTETLELEFVLLFVVPLVFD